MPPDADEVGAMAGVDRTLEDMLINANSPTWLKVQWLSPAEL
jgi:hypothetical protein